MNILRDETKKYNRGYSSKPPVINRPNTITRYFSSHFWLVILIGVLCLGGKTFGGFACLSNPCIFGVCIDDLNSTYSCYCIDGYTGIQCQTNWDECWSSPCANGGSCIDGVAHYNCSCPEGFVGQNCEENLDECLSNPCQNGGICHDKDNGYICTCMPGYLGEHCENDVAVCDTGKGTRCHNGGECKEGKGLEFTCKCSPGWEGIYCDEEIDECASAPCQNGGVCIDKLANYACACSMGFTGSNCEESVLVCEDSPCENSALCLMEEGQPVCYCVPDFHGEKCEFQYDECQLGPRCTNGGTCIDGVDDFSCSCPPSITGILCECLILSSGDLDCNYTRTDLPTTSTVYSFENRSTDFTTTTTIQTTTLEDDITTILSTIADSTTPKTESTSEKDMFTTSTIFVPISTITTTTATGIETTTFEYTTTTEPIITTSIKDDTTEMSSTIQSTIHQSTTDDYDKITTTTIVGTSTTEEVTITTPKIDIITVTDKDNNDNQSTITTTSSPLSTTINTTYSSILDDTTVFSTTLSYITPETSETETLYTTEKFKSTTFSTLSPFFTESPETKTTTEEYLTETTTTSPTTTTSSTTTPSTTTSTSTSSTTTESSPSTTEKTTMTTESFTTFTTPISSSSSSTSSYSPTPSSSSSSETTTYYTTYDLENSTGSMDCMRIPCYNGGTCVNTSEGSRCVCRFDRQGSLCESPVIIRNAAFAGDSYLSHRIEMYNKYDIDSIEPELSMRIEITGRTRAMDGLILLAAAQGNRGGHYIALFLHRGLLQFQFSCGLQTMLLSELEAPVNTGDEMLIQAELDFSRNHSHCNASLRVNDTLAMSGDQPTWLSLQTYEHQAAKSIENTWLHLGGAPQAPFGLMSDLPAGQGFTGCLHNLKVNGKTREIFSNALDGFGITECGSLACLSNPCRNGAICIEEVIQNDNNDKDDKNTIEIYKRKQQQKQRQNDKWKCKCPTGYMGLTCEISVCDNNPCQYGGTCVTFPGSGYLCLCPLGKHGHYCEHNMEVAQPSFSGSVKGLSSYVAYPVPVPLEYTMELSFKISPTTISQIALLAFLGQSGFHDDKSDHLAISFIQGYIMLTWNLGGGPRRIFIQKPIELRNDGQSHEIKIGRTGRKAWLSVDGKANITGRSPGELTRLDVLPILYLGGHEHANFSTLPHDLPLHSGFQGCIFDVQLKAGLVSVPLQDTKGVRGRGVGQCGTRECHRYACQHEGACLQYGATFTCICQEGWFGPLCAQQTHVCDSSNNQCSSDSFCVPLVNSYECDCPSGKVGRNCDFEIKSLSDVSMSGRRSFLSVNWPTRDKSSTVTSAENEISHAHYRQTPIKRFHSFDLLKPRTISNSILFKFVNENDQPIKNNSIQAAPSLPQPMILKTIEQTNRVQFFSIELQVRPLSERGILIFFGSFDENNDKNIGFVSLSLQGGVVEFRIGGPQNQISIVRSSRILAIGEWHKIKMSQNGKRLTLWVEGSTTQTILQSGFVFLNQEEIIYVGGLPDLSKLPYNAVSGFPIPFRGCVRQISINGNRVVLNETNILESRNILDCDGTACGGDSCDLGGHCWLDERLQPHCKCPQSAKGYRCEVPESCDIISCKNGGRCNGRECNCPNGWGGFYCEIATSKYSTPSFHGNSYLVIPPRRIPQKDKRAGPSLYVKPREFVQVSLKFSTIHPDGLLLWTSKQDTKFLGIGIENGHIKLASSLLGINNSTVDVPAGGFVSDGGWHTVQIEVDKNLIVLSVNGRTIFSEKRRNLNMNKMDENQYVTMEDIFFIGGVIPTESIKKLTKNKFNKPFTGCLQDVTFGSEPKLQIDDFTSYEGENIGSCELYDEFINN